jgi:hypothetical protein
MKWLRASLFIIICCAVMRPTLVYGLDAIPYTPPTDLADSPIIITAYSLVSGMPRYVQIFNTSSKPVLLGGWKVTAGASDGTTFNLASLSGWIAPSNYLLIAEGSGVSGADFIYNLESAGTGSRTLQLTSPSDSLFAPNVVAVSSDGMYQRKLSSTTGNYLSSFEKVSTPVLFGGGYYEYPTSTPIKASEILANPRMCSPVDAALDCLDYVKLYNPSDEEIDLSAFRLRVGYSGQDATASNTYLLTGTIQPGHFKTVTEDIDGRGLSLTNTGSYIWLEDTYGIQRYDTTVQSYEDASSSSKKGQAWAYDILDGTWKWTTQPTPGDLQSIFPAPPVAPVVAVDIKTYAPCEAGQYRSDVTHRCRSLAVSATSLTPCPDGQYRSPDTNRCRTVAKASSSPEACAPGQERNPDTNRCRKVAQALGAADFKVEPVVETGKAFAGWWALGGIGTLASAYGAWEWRREVLGGIRKFGMFFTSGR